MSSRKGKGGAAAGNKKKSDVESDKENILQAVVLTDSYQTRFRPLTLETPRCLLPLANVPLIEYTLEFLALAGVQEVFIFVSAGGEKIQKYILASKWNRRSSPFTKCDIIMSPTAMSVGDAMRELDAKGLISTDFLLVNGDFVSNMPLEGVLAEHRKRRMANKDAIMTMILKEAGFNHRTKARGEAGAFVIDETNNQCVHYEEMRPHELHELKIPEELFKKHTQLSVRSDLIDCHVDICSPDVPALFTENFDYQHIRRHFLHGILTDFDLYGKTVHTHIVKDHYAARVRSIQTYDSVSRDIITRWTVPLVPDSNLDESHSYTLERGNIYKEDNVYLGRSAIINRNTILGANCHIGNGSVLTSCVLGRNVTIGDNVVLTRCYIWDNAHIESNCTITKSIIASNAHIGASTTIEPGSIISYDVKIAPSSTIRRFSKLTNHKRKLTLPVPEQDELYTPLSGSDYTPSDSESESETTAAARDAFDDAALSDASTSSISVLGSDTDDSDSDFDAPRKTTRSDSVTSASSAGDADAGFAKEAIAGLLTAFDENQEPNLAGMELNNLRMATNVNFAVVRRAIAAAFVRHTEALIAREALTPGKAAAAVLGRYGKEVMSRGVFERGDRAELLGWVERECAAKKNPEAAGAVLNAVVMVLYNLDLVEEEDVVRWWADGKGETGDAGKDVRAKVAAFIKWLAEADEEESEEETEEESEEEESEEESDDE